MRIIWTDAAKSDVARLHDFLARHDLEAADRVFDRLIAAPEALQDFPRRGSRVGRYRSREVREFRTGKYLLRYELAGSDIFVLRFFHEREGRF